jgi:hypothetical protein
MTKLTNIGVEKALLKMQGNVSAAARARGVTRAAIHYRINKNPALQQIVFDCRETIADDAETMLAAQVLAGDGAQIRYALSTIGRNRGYGQKSTMELVGANGQPIDVKHRADKEVLATLKALEDAIHAGAMQLCDELGIPQDDPAEHLHPEEAAPV